MEPPDLRDTTQACVAAAQAEQGQKAKEVESLAKVSTAPLDIESIRTRDPRVILRERRF